MMKRYILFPVIFLGLLGCSLTEESYYLKKYGIQGSETEGVYLKFFMDLDDEDEYRLNSWNQNLDSGETTIYVVVNEESREAFSIERIWFEETIEGFEVLEPSGSLATGDLRTKVVESDYYYGYPTTYYYFPLVVRYTKNTDENQKVRLFIRGNVPMGLKILQVNGDSYYSW